MWGKVPVVRHGDQGVLPVRAVPLPTVLPLPARASLPHHVRDEALRQRLREGVAREFPERLHPGALVRKPNPVALLLIGTEVPREQHGTEPAEVHRADPVGLILCEGTAMLAYGTCDE